MGDMTVDEAENKIKAALFSGVPLDFWGHVYTVLTALATSSHASGWAEGAGAMKRAMIEAGYGAAESDNDVSGIEVARSLYLVPLPPCPAPGGGKESP